ncbi:YibE/F family protein [Enterococcus saccharolyticus]|uniref:YibE/F family protein n=1 Tax=Enterococcus TaxID=1350 RepID=UPI001E53AD9D|nr:YibE/F family protein [Enterococcus saccharolyticus]MCD5003235.1 YibE/F family protein [Enterococcus saccharolyticus]
MRRKIILTGIAMFICVIVSMCIQAYSAVLYKEPIAKIEQVTIQEEKQVIQAEVLNGREKGKSIKLFSNYQENEVENTKLVEGNQVFFQNEEVTEKKRDGFVFFIVTLLLLTLIAIGGKTGLTTFISAGLNSAALVLMVWFYREHSDISLLPLTMLYMIFAVGLTLFLIDGFKKNSLQKFFATIVTILAAYFICYFTMSLLHDKGLRFEDLGVLTRPYRPIFLASLLIGAIGASLDTVVTVISTLEEIEQQNRQVTLKQLIQSGQIIGKDVSGTMINVLICSYFSSAIPMILVYLFNGWNFMQAMNMLLSLEAVRVICGGFGILLSIPISLGFFYFGRRKA